MNLSVTLLSSLLYAGVLLLQLADLLVLPEDREMSSSAVRMWLSEPFIAALVVVGVAGPMSVLVTSSLITSSRIPSSRITSSRITSSLITSSLLL